MEKYDIKNITSHRIHQVRQAICNTKPARIMDGKDDYLHAIPRITGW
jgi:hypothetical protein